MTPALALLVTLGALLPAAEVKAAYRPCARPVPQDAPPAVRKEVFRLRDASEVTRGYAAYALYKMGPRAAAAVPFLRHLLTDDSPLRSFNQAGSVNWTGPTCPGMLAAEALWAIRPAEITDVLRQGPETARLHAARVLGGVVRDPRALAPLLLAAKDRSAEVRHAAVLTLGRSSSPDALAAVRAALGDASAKVRVRAITALGKRKDSASLPAMLRILAGDKDAWPRGYAAWYLGELGGERAVPALTRSLQDPSAYVRRYAASSLGALGDARAVEPLLARVSDPDAEVRREVGQALERFDDPRIAAAAVGELSNADAACRLRAVAAVGRYPDTYASHLIRSLGDTDFKVRHAAAEALSRADAHAAAAAAALAKCLGNTTRDGSIRESALFGALHRLGNPAVKELGKVLLSAPTTNRFGQTRDLAPRAARALAEIGTPEAKSALEAGLSAPSAAARRETQRLLKVRSFARGPSPPAQPQRKAKPKPRRQPKPPDAGAEAIASRRPAARRAAARGPVGVPAGGGGSGGGQGGGYRLTGIIGSVAILNGKTVQVGDTVNGATVVAIRGMQVELKSSGRRFTVGLSGGPRK